MMLPSPSFALSALLTLPAVVKAGNVLWEGTVKLQIPEPVVQIEVDAAGYAVKGAVKSALHRRYFAFDPKFKPAAGQDPNPDLWHDRTIPYCFETPEARKELHGLIKEALQEWRREWAGRAGDSKDRFLTWRYLGDSMTGEACTKHIDRKRILVIRSTTNDDLGPSLASSLGVQIGKGVRDSPGPYTALTSIESMGMLRDVSNIAHELGHVMGLAHEHQNPFTWSGTSRFAGQGASNGFGRGDTFDCSVITGYADLQQKIDARMAIQPAPNPPITIESACTNRKHADEVNFLAKDWLPLQERTRFVGHPNPDRYKSYEHIDWNSLMIYPSGAGGTTTGAYVPGGPDVRRPVLKKTDGSLIPRNFHASALDIQGLKYLYYSKDIPTPKGSPLATDPFLQHAIYGLRNFNKVLFGQCAGVRD